MPPLLYGRAWNVQVLTPDQATKQQPTGRGFQMAQRDVSLGRHRRLCSVCQRTEYEEIEAAFIVWTSPASIAVSYRIV